MFTSRQVGRIMWRLLIRWPGHLIASRQVGALRLCGRVPDRPLDGGKRLPAV